MRASGENAGGSGTIVSCYPGARPIGRSPGIQSEIASRSIVALDSGLTRFARAHGCPVRVKATMKGAPPACLYLSLVMAGLVPAIPLKSAPCFPKRGSPG
jgi:hypothetical protein